jgi:hypothetical protein
LDTYGTGPDRHRFCGEPIRTFLQTAQSNGIPSSQPSYGVFGLVRCPLSWLGCSGDSHLCPTPFSTHSGIKVRYLDPRTGVERCCSAGTDTRRRRHRHVHLSDPRTLITSSRMSAKSLRHTRRPESGEGDQFPRKRKSVFENRARMTDKKVLINPVDRLCYSRLPLYRELQIHRGRPPHCSLSRLRNLVRSGSACSPVPIRDPFH